ncbi:MAG: DegV family protein [Ruminococcaceae bacterium]|nr:DegV family protein [Oscillospiraceae bacterium]
MNKYVILTDSSSDLSASLMQELGVEAISLEVNMDGEEPKYNHEVVPSEFYAKLRTKVGAKTSAASMDAFTNFFEKHLKEGKDVIYLGFSSGLSVTYTNGKNAAEDLMEQYPDRKIVAIDTLCASLGQGLLVALAARKKAEGASFEEVVDFVESNKLHLCHWFTVDDLFFLKRGGRVSAATAVVGTMLAIKPVMHVDNDGHLINVSKARGRKAAINALADKLSETGIEPDGQLIYICHGDCLEDAQYLADTVKAKYPNCEIMIDYTGPVIGAHSGPGTLALFYLGTER